MFTSAQSLSSNAAKKSQFILQSLPACSGRDGTQSQEGVGVRFRMIQHNAQKLGDKRKCNLFKIQFKWVQHFKVQTSVLAFATLGFICQVEENERTFCCFLNRTKM